MSNLDDNIRLNTFLALHKGISRREADDLIASGMVLVNNKPVTLGARIKSSDIIKIGGVLLQTKQKITTIVLNKPVGYVCSKKQQDTNPTVYSLLPTDLQNLKTVGRLDKNSSGLILLTNDGQLAYRLTHPKFHKSKKYIVTLDKNLEPFHHQAITHFGINLDDGLSKFELEKLAETDSKTWTVTMFEGRNRQIRRTFKALGYEVTKLHRTALSNYILGDLKSGAWKTVE